MRQTQLAARIGCRPETLSRWETGEMPTPRAEQLAMVAILDAVDPAGGLKEYLAQERARSKRTFEVQPPRRACG